MHCINFSFVLFIDSNITLSTEHFNNYHYFNDLIVFIYYFKHYISINIDMLKIFFAWNGFYKNKNVNRQ